MPNQPDLQLWLILFFPLLGALINGTLGRRLPKAVISAIAIGSVALSFFWVVRALSELGRISNVTLTGSPRGI
jgi:NADH-quinone oxidoreductase subunit L